MSFLVETFFFLFFFFSSSLFWRFSRCLDLPKAMSQVFLKPGLSGNAFLLFFNEKEEKKKKPFWSKRPQFLVWRLPKGRRHLDVLFVFLVIELFHVFPRIYSSFFLFFFFF